MLGSGVFDKDQYDLHNAYALFIFDESVNGRRDSVPQTVQHFLHGEVLLSAYFPMPCPDRRPGDLQVLCPAEPVIMPGTEHQRKKDPPPGCRNRRKAENCCVDADRKRPDHTTMKKVKYGLNKELKAKIDICRSVNMNSGKADRPAD